MCEELGMLVESVSIMNFNLVFIGRGWSSVKSWEGEFFSDVIGAV